MHNPAIPGMLREIADAIQTKGHYKSLAPVDFAVAGKQDTEGPCCIVINPVYARTHDSVQSDQERQANGQLWTEIYLLIDEHLAKPEGYSSIITWNDLHDGDFVVRKLYWLADIVESENILAETV